MKAELRCGWCNELIGQTNTIDGAASHGICDACLKLHFAAFYDDIMAHRPPDNTSDSIPGSERTHPHKHITS